MSDADDLMLPAEVVARLRVKSEATLARWRHEGKGPAHFKIGKRVVYERAAVEAYIADERRRARDQQEREHRRAS